jgi:Fur family transcriptional regulator, ferric uptake regulator
VTRAQRAVLEVLRDETGFVSAQSIHARLRAADASVGLTSVYRALQALADDGALDVVRSGSGELTYRRCASDDHHHHLLCSSCGATVEVEAPALERWVADVARRHDYRVDGHTLEISGTCAACVSSGA